MPDNRPGNGGRSRDAMKLRDTMNWCHMCGKWREVRSPAYLCAVCIDEWSAAYADRRERNAVTDE